MEKEQLFKKFENEMREWDKPVFINTAKFMEGNKGICESICLECPFASENNVNDKHCVTSGYCFDVATNKKSVKAEQSAKAFLEYVEMKKNENLTINELKEHCKNQIEDWEWEELKKGEKMKEPEPEPNNLNIEVLTRKEITAKIDGVELHLDTYIKTFSLSQGKNLIACDFDELYKIMTLIKQEKEKK